jgi:predicted AlkP superfamily pyrophosphatase or phosphodiesterase
MTRARQVHICVLIDALGWRILQGLDFLNDLLPYRRPLRTVLGYSSGAIPTILTGQYPTQTGNWNLLYYDPERSPFHWLRYSRFLPDHLLNHRVTRKLVKEVGRRLLGMGPTFECLVSPNLLPWFNWVERSNIYRRGGIPGSLSIFDHLYAAHISYRVYSYHTLSDRDIFRRANHDLQESDARFFFLYLSELDQFLHDHWDQQNLFHERLDSYDAALRSLFTLARAFDPGASFTIFSDHGMTPIHRRYDLVNDIEKLQLRMPDDYLAVYDSTMARFWFFSDRAQRQIVEALQANPCGRILSDQELQSLGIFFSDRRYGELIFLLHPGWLMTRSNFNGRQWMPQGMHGYHPDDPYSDAIFLCDRQPSTRASTIADVYSHMQHIVDRCR